MDSDQLKLGESAAAGHRRADPAIIAGALIAYELGRAGLRVAIVDAGTAPTSTRRPGAITASHSCGPSSRLR